MRRAPLRYSLLALLAAVSLLSASSGPASASRERYSPPTSTAGPPIPEATETPPPPSPTAATVQLDAATIVVSGGAISAPAVAEQPAPEANVRARPEERPIEAAAAGEQAGSPGDAQAAVRLNDPILRWLPEILLAAAQSGTPAHIIAGVMRLESGGNPNIISPVGARGLMQVMPSNLSAMGVPEYLWHDPATNILAGGLFLASRVQIYGSWDQAVGAYFGFGCDLFGTCTDVYIQVAFAWAAYYQPAIADPLSSGFAVLPADWVPPPISPFVEAAPAPVEAPPSVPAPSSVPTATPSPDAGETPPPTDVPTEAPTPAPTDIPTEIPTEPPTQIPTEVPTEAPAEAPVDPPAGDGTPAA